MSFIQRDAGRSRQGGAHVGPGQPAITPILEALPLRTTALP